MVLMCRKLEAECLLPAASDSSNHITSVPDVELGQCESPINESQLGSHAHKQEPFPSVDKGSVSSPSAKGSSSVSDSASPFFISLLGQNM